MHEIFDIWALLEKKSEWEAPLSEDCEPLYLELEESQKLVCSLSFFRVKIIERTKTEELSNSLFVLFVKNLNYDIVVNSSRNT